MPIPVWSCARTADAPGARHEESLIDCLEQIDGVELLPGVAHTSCREGQGIVAVRLQGLDSADLGLLLEQRGIAVRAGAHCSASEDVVGDSVRLSLHAYTAGDEIDRCLEAIEDIGSAWTVTPA